VLLVAIPAIYRPLTCGLEWHLRGIPAISTHGIVQLTLRATATASTACSTALRKAVPAIYWPVTAWLKRHLGWIPAFSAHRVVHWAIFTLIHLVSTPFIGMVRVIR